MYYVKNLLNIAGNTLHTYILTSIFINFTFDFRAIIITKMWETAIKARTTTSAQVKCGNRCWSRARGCRSTKPICGLHASYVNSIVCDLNTKELNEGENNNIFLVGKFAKRDREFSRIVIAMK